MVEKKRPQIIDLTRPIKVGFYPQVHPCIPFVEVTPMWGHKRFFRDMVLIEQYGIASEKLPWYGGEDTNMPEKGAYYRVCMDDHTGTHIDAALHLDSNGAPASQIPLEYCYSDGVVLDVRGKEPGAEIMAKDLQDACTKINYKIKPLDIVLLRTGVTETEEGREIDRLLNVMPTAIEKIKAPANLRNTWMWVPQPGPGREAIEWLADQGVKIIATDVFLSMERPFPLIAQEVNDEGKEAFAAHAVARERGLHFVESARNFNKIPKPYGFKICCFPLRMDTSGSPIRMVAIIE